MQTSPQFYTWKELRCAYTVHGTNNSQKPALVLIHPIGVGLSGAFWQRFIKEWLASHNDYTIYNPDLLGCGASDLPAVAYYSIDWANQLKSLIENVIKKPVILIVQGASFPIAIELLQVISKPDSIKGLVLSTPPAWRTMTEAAKPLQNKLLWNLLFNSPIGLGKLFYNYARRRQFIESFSERQLFGDADKVDANWLDSLTTEAKNTRTRYAVFSFLAGFWRKDYTQEISQIKQPTLVVWGEQTSSISKESKGETVEERSNFYLQHLSHGEVKIIEGRNVLPYESTSKFVSVVSDFLQESI